MAVIYRFGNGKVGCFLKCSKACIRFFPCYNCWFSAEKEDLK
jgi:hypothetical protein